MTTPRNIQKITYTKYYNKFTCQNNWKKFWNMKK